MKQCLSLEALQEQRELVLSGKKKKKNDYSFQAVNLHKTIHRNPELIAFIPFVSFKMKVPNFILS